MATRGTGRAKYWPTSDHEPFASFINGVPKWVATSKPLDIHWDGAAAIDGSLDDFVHDLKTHSGSDIGGNWSCESNSVETRHGPDVERDNSAPRRPTGGSRTWDGRLQQI